MHASQQLPVRAMGKKLNIHDSLNLSYGGKNSNANDSCTGDPAGRPYDDSLLI
jgi:hypothetical protein